MGNAGVSPFGFEFPSPGGDYGLSDRTGAEGPTRGRASFRPLAGITVFRTVVTVIAANNARPRFPSPGGDYGLSDLRQPGRNRHRPVGFRPLAGITVFRTGFISLPKGRRQVVSVPWRGLRSFGPISPPERPTSHSSVSVPWRGLRSFGPGLVQVLSRISGEFPSPGGDYGLSDTGGGIMATFASVHVSVPWRGLRSFGLPSSLTRPPR